MLYSDNFWQEDTLINFPSPACLIFFVKSKTGNQPKIYYCLHILVADNSVNSLWFSVKKINVRLQTSSLQTCGLLTVPTLILWITGYWGILQERVYRKSVKDVDELKLRLIEAWSGIQQSVIDQAIDQWQIRLNACVKAKGKHFEHML